MYEGIAFNNSIQRTDQREGYYLPRE